MVVFIDLDGTLLFHHESGAVKQWRTCKLLPGVLELFDQLERDGHYIVLVTSRKSSTQLVTMLQDAGLFWDQLITGLPRGGRVLINDSPVKAIRVARNSSANAATILAGLNIEENRETA